MPAQPGVFASGASPSPEALRAAQGQMLRDTDLQFSFSKAAMPVQTHLPHWLEAILRAIGKVIAWLAPYLGYIFMGGLALALLAVLYFLGRELLRTRFPDMFKHKPVRVRPVDWRPDAAVALALLEEADRLAAAGSYAEAVRLILHRSIEDIEGRRPRLVRPALTSREISRLQDIPEAARGIFASIAAVVERSLFGGRDVDAAGFAECRRIYQDFALPGAWA